MCYRIILVCGICLFTACSSGDPAGTIDYWISAEPPPFEECEPGVNQILVMLGDGTVLGPYDASFEDDNSSYTGWSSQYGIRYGVGRIWAQVYGDTEGNQAGSPIPLATPAEDPGNALVGLFVDETLVPDGLPFLAGSFGFPAEDPWETVGGEVVFHDTPGWGTGAFFATLQNDEQRQRGRIVTAAVSGCFDTATLPQ